MEEAVGEPVGLGMGFQAGGLIGLYLGFSLATISVLTDAENIQRTVSLMCIPPFLFSLILGPFLARRKKPVILTKEPLIEAREKLSKFNEGQGKWRVLSHVSSDGVNLRIDMHNLDKINLDKLQTLKANSAPRGHNITSSQGLGPSSNGTPAQWISTGISTGHWNALGHRPNLLQGKTSKSHILELYHQNPLRWRKSSGIHWSSTGNPKP